MTHILSVEQLRKLGRPIGKMVDSTKLEAFITEAEQLHVKPIIGDSLYLRLLSEIEKKRLRIGIFYFYLKVENITAKTMVKVKMMMCICSWVYVKRSPIMFMQRML